ncbi:leucine-rich repeat domain-containing protein [Thalassotalea sp. ND16A]|uniref:leucine-rich repeat domain-containing protein n=1 Tax=Thalassotalea sp. ND16A TaxID=1535422 RepID=UPI00051DFC53|nr:leucine-rich repeat domain-containing protein [Thalassotalea sp. ND16A]KGJ95693.1 hypothetical protein ND16A_1228 [Thalassotalea sp. ND16A]
MTTLKEKFIRQFLSLMLSIIAAYLSQQVVAAEFMSEVTAKDKALVLCINELATKNNWQGINDVKIIKCHGKGIKQLTGLAIFANLEELSLFNNDLRAVDLRPFKQLKNVNISNNKLKKIQLSNLANLHTLYLFKNQLTTIDFSGLSQLKKLRITNNKLHQVDISELVSLEKAYFFDNKLEDLSLRGLAKLNFIELRQNPMPDEVYDRYDALEGITIIHDGNADDWK